MARPKTISLNVIFFPGGAVQANFNGTPLAFSNAVEAKTTLNNLFDGIVALPFPGEIVISTPESTQEPNNNE